MRISKLIIEDVRCFKGRHEFEIKPLTFITGANSTGKSTILACWQVLADWLGGIQPLGTGINFNTSPYQMGSFDEIIRRADPKLTQFAIGFETAFDTEDTATLTSMFHLRKQSKGSEPKITRIEHTLRRKNREVLMTEKYTDARHRIFNPLFPFTFDMGALFGHHKNQQKEAQQKIQEKYEDFISLAQSIYPPENSKSDSDNVSYASLLIELASNIRHLLRNVVSIAPIRAAPQRTYDPVVGFDPSQGDDMPMILRNMATRSPKKWRAMQQQLREFGMESGMFKEISAKKFGRSGSNPFQIEVQAVHSPKTNLIDVGYGTSQILPILVRAIKVSQTGRICLMQQPEVHLHPQGQAALTSFLIDLIKTPHKRIPPVFVVETHSDHMIDRARIHIVKKKFKPENLSIIYLEAKDEKEGVQESNITVDAQGNIEGFPDGYREFFMRETNKLLGFE